MVLDPMERGFEDDMLNMVKIVKGFVFKNLLILFNFNLPMNLITYRARKTNN